MTIGEYFSKMKGGSESPPGVGVAELVWSWIGAAAGIMICGYLSAQYFEPRESTLLIGSFGATAVLLYAAIASPLAQPRNLVGGHIISGLIGVACHQLFGDITWLAASMGVSLAIVAMLATKTLHPPAGATALIAVMGGEKIHQLGYLFAILPVGVGVMILLAVALLFNNIPRNRRYPEFWF